MLVLTGMGRRTKSKQTEGFSSTLGARQQWPTFTCQPSSQVSAPTAVDWLYATGRPKASTKYQTQELNWLALHLQHNFASRRGRDQRRMLAGISSTRYSSTEVQLTLGDPLSSSKAWGCTRTLSSARCLLTKPEGPESRTQNQRKADAPSQQVAGLAAAL